MEPQLRPLFERRLTGQIGVTQFEREAQALGVSRSQLYPQYGYFEREKKGYRIRETPTPEAAKILEARELELEQHKKLMSLLPGADLERIQTHTMMQRLAARYESRKEYIGGDMKIYTYYGHLEAEYPDSCEINAVVRCEVTFHPPYETTQEQVRQKLIDEIPEKLVGQLHTAQYKSTFIGAGKRETPSGNSVEAFKSLISNIILNRLEANVEDGETRPPDFWVEIKGRRCFEFTPQVEHAEMD